VKVALGGRGGHEPALFCREEVRRFGREMTRISHFNAMCAFTGRLRQIRAVDSVGDEMNR
jgi:hypothetical protein